MCSKSSSWVLVTGSILLLGFSARAAAPVVPPPAAAHQVPTRPIVSAPPPMNPTSLDTLIAWDAISKDQVVTNGAQEAHFTFNLTNISDREVVITGVGTSCGCTAAKLPENPWHLAAGTNGSIQVTMSVVGKSGTVTKTVTVSAEGAAPKVLVVRSIIQLPPAAGAGMDPNDRQRNQQMALADRQAVFKGDCAKCHADTARDEMGREKMGHALYTAVCGVCHDAAHRASMVTDLRSLPHETNEAFWKLWIEQGKAGSLMPAFAKAQGGPLSDAQIASLVTYLTANMPSKPQVPVPNPAAGKTDSHANAAH